MDRSIATVRVLIAVYGYEPEEWPRTVLSGIPSDLGLMARLLVVLDVPRPPFTSLTPWARRRYETAWAASSRLADDRARPMADELGVALGGRLDVVRVTSKRADPGAAIAAHAAEWEADLVVVAEDTSSWLQRALFGRVHERVVRRAPCVVGVVPAHARSVPKPLPVTLAPATAEGHR